HAVLHARSHLRPTTDGAGRLLVTLRHRRSVQRTLGAAGQPLDAVGILRTREPAHAGVSPLTRGRYLVKRTLRHPIRGDRLHPKPSSRQPRKSTWNREARQPRMRPRKSVNVASLVGSPEDEPSRPNLRLRVVGIAVLVLFLVLVLRLWTLQIIDGKSFAAAVNRNQVRVVDVAAPRGEIVDRNDTVLVSNVPEQEVLLSHVTA